jgi:sigma54-dependent transcription regulator
MATRADGGRITEKLVDDEIARIKANWIEVHNDSLSDLPSADQLSQIDVFDRLQLQSVIEVCRRRVLRWPGRSVPRRFRILLRASASLRTASTSNEAG